VFDRELTASSAALVAACRWALAQRAQLLNLSLGTLNDEHESDLADVIEDTRRAGAAIIAAAPEDDKRWLPGSLPGVWRVTLDWTLPRDRCRARVMEGDVAIQASGYPRPIPGVPPERNLKGLSFAVANATGLIASLFERDNAVNPFVALRQAIANGDRRFDRLD
jgi:hypothetical protein